MVCGSLPLRTPPVRACYALFLAGAVVVALPPRCIGQTDTTPAPTDSTTRPTHSYFIDAARLTREGAVRDVGELLMDRVPGLLVTPGSGLTDMGSRIRVRGVQTLDGDRAPVVLVDGVRVGQTEDDFQPTSGFAAVGPLRTDDLDPEDIESVELLRGPASAAVYGPGAGAGVLLIHTKRGHPGPPRWEAHVQGGVAAVPAASWPATFGGVDLANPDSMYRRGWCTLPAEAAGQCVQDFVQQFNPLAQRSPFRTALRRQYGLSVAGGGARVDYRVAGTFDGDAGPYSSGIVTPDPNSYRRVSVRASGAVRPWSTVELRASGGYVSSHLRLPPGDPVLASIYGPSDSTGFSWSPFFQGKDTQALERPFAVVEARWSALSWLTLRGLAGADKVDLWDGVIERPSPDTTPQYRAASHRQTTHRTLEFGASATHAVSAALRLRTTLGVQRLRSELLDLWGAGCSACPGGSLWERQQSLGYYLQEEVDIHDRVLVTGAVRHDHFDAIYPSTTYPSVGVSWRVRAADSASFSLLQLRAAYGSAGLEPTTLPPFAVAFALDRSGEAERNRSFELGADAALQGGRLGGSITYYDMRSHVLNYGQAYTYNGGYVPTYNPGAVVSNRGIEATLTGKLLTGPRLGWDMTLSLWGNRNRLLKGGLPTFFGSPFVQMLLPGYPVGGYWAFPIQSYTDANGDGIIAPSEVRQDLSRPLWMGTPYPTQGAALTARWTLGTRFSAAVTLDYRAGQTLFNETAWRQCLYLVCRAVNDLRTPLAEQAQAEAFSAPAPGYFQDADYLKLRELSLTFSAPPNIAAALHARSATITLAGRDLATWTGYSGADPESGSYGVSPPGEPRSVSDFATLPVPHSWTLRLDLSY